MGIWGGGIWGSDAGGSSVSGGGNWGEAEEITIVSGAITVEAGKWYKIIPEGLAASDDLDTINGLTEGTSVLLSANDGTKTVVLKNGTGNLDINFDISLDDITDRTILVYDGLNLVEASSRP